jgi:uncharacterized membrane protein
MTMGRLPAPGSVGEFAGQVLGTREGWNLILLGNAVGFLFAVLVLTLTVISFPMLLDRMSAWRRRCGPRCRPSWRTR